jgi:hypothetical protein
MFLQPVTVHCSISAGFAVWLTVWHSFHLPQFRPAARATDLYSHAVCDVFF